ncbi:hypothetical protein FDP41_003370 [Naegleria fowleri]|uniref:Epoxide hydrolase N-terminal domain-containing protein n=1 Tax=Naegleria fowleri TaxID=5763 RepID=A0A6A5BTW4_NAEFO|nr:uncharacterized protein FDP41_003370 [Naegleria fowleri]KAF0977378.1 hypothetical protein FDP41_003370 [Naegleria fowleri]CAG4709789.1 unnamed protein product [Naegleria fowleri]
MSNRHHHPLRPLHLQFLFCLLFLVAILLLLPHHLPCMAMNPIMMMDRSRQEEHHTTSENKEDSSLLIRPFIIPYAHSEHLKLLFRLNETLSMFKKTMDRVFPKLYSKTSLRWEMGTDLDQVVELVQYWHDVFDWKGQVEKLNTKLPHYETTLIDDDDEEVMIRFAWRKSSLTSKKGKMNGERKVLLLLHGWPGSVWEFHNMVDELVQVHGYDVVAPSIPGYGYSFIPKREGCCDVKKVASLFVKLMKQLGYGKYIVQGGDWGSIIGEHVARLDPSHCIGYHSNMCVVLPYWQDWIQVAIDALKKLIFGTPLIENTESFSSFLMYAVKYFTIDGGYQHLQSTRPDSLGIALLDSPVGMMAYLLEKFIAWTDLPQKDTSQLFSRISRDDFLTNVMIYQTTQTIASSIRLYYFTMTNQKSFGEDKPYLSTPTACAVFKDLFRATRYTAQRNFNLVQFNRYEQGGHFAALENPKVLIQDVIQFANTRYEQMGSDEDDASQHRQQAKKNEL